MDVRREEMISAYLDGELNTAERQEAEQLLAADADARALLEDLRGLRVKLRALPRHQLEPDFAEHVLVLAEQARTAGQRDLAADKSTEIPALQPAVSPQDRFGSDGDSVRPPYERDLRRPLIWAGLAIAAALLVMLYGGPQPATTVARKSVDQAADDAAEVADAAKDTARRRATESRDLQMSAAPEDTASHGISSKDTATQPPAPSVEMATGATQEATTDRATALAKSAAREKAVDLDEADVAAPGKPAADQASRKEHVGQVARQRKVGDTEALAELHNDGTALFYLAAAAPMNKRELNRQLEDRLKSVKQRQGFPAPTDEFQQDKFAAARANWARASVKLQKSEATDAGLELVYAVEGTRQQIAAALGELQAQPNALQLVAVAPQVAANYGEALRGNYRVHPELRHGALPDTRDVADALAAESEAPLAGKAGARPDQKAMALRRAGQAATAADANRAAAPRISRADGAGADGAGAGGGASFARRSAITKRKDDLRPVEGQPEQAGSEAFGGGRRGTADIDRGRPALKSARPQSVRELADRAEGVAGDSPARPPGTAPAAPTAEEQKAGAFGGAEPTAPKQAVTPRPPAADRAPAEAELAAEAQPRGASLRRILLVIRLSPDASNVPAAASALKKSLDADAASEAVEPNPDGGPPAEGNK